jgi:hypothetical protein
MVGGAVVQQHQLTRAHRDFPDLQIGTGVAGDTAAAPARSAQYLLHRGADPARVTGQGLLLAGMGSPGPDGPARRELLRPQRQAYRLATPQGGIQFHPGHSDWITILRGSGFLIDALHEIYAPPDAPDHPYYTLASAEWARQWPAEEIWAAHLAG